MSIPNYVRPQLTIKQLLDRTPAASISRINAVVIGPQYLLSRYGKESAATYTFDSSAFTIPFEYVNDSGQITSLTTEVVDLESVKLYAEKLEAVLASSLNSNVTVPDLSNPAIIKSAANFAGTTGLDTNLRSRPMAVNDVVYITSASGTVRRTVTGLVGKDIAASIGTNINKDDGKALNSTYNAATAVASATTLAYPAGYTAVVAAAASFNNATNYGRGPRYNGKFGDKFTLTVITGGVPGVSIVRVTSASGLYSKSALTSTDPSSGSTHAFSDAELGGVTFNVSGGGALVVGQVFVFEVYGTWTQLPTDEVSNSLLIAGTYAGTKDTTYMIRVTGTNTSAQNATGAKLYISDTAGVEAPYELTLSANTTAHALGTKGITVGITLSATAPTQLLVGETYYVHAVAAKASTTEFDKAVLSGPAVDTSIHTNPATTVTVKHVLEFSGEIENDDASDASAWTASASGVAVDGSLSLFVDARASGYKWVAFDDNVGKVAVSFRALVPSAYGEGLIALDSASDITELLGDIDIDNDLAFGANEALSGAQGQRIYALRVDSDDVDGFNAAFAKIESTDLTYSLAILSDSDAVKQAAKSHVLAMSTEEQKKFRRAYVGTDSPGSYLKLKYASDGDLVLATVTSNGSAFTLVTVNPDNNPGVDFTALGLVAGDKVKIAGGTYDIKTVISASQLELKAGPGAGISPAQPVEIWKADTPLSQVQYIAQVSSGLGTRRVCNVWVENGTKLLDGVSTFIPSRFVAAEIAGLRSAVLPQQGLTRTEVTSITEAASMHVRYTPTLLDQAAAAGTYVVTQDVESGTVFIRHQLTTETDKGSLYYEDSVGVNLDNISFAIKDLLDGYIGKYNVNRKTITEIRNRVYQLLNTYTQSDIDTGIGPALVGFADLVVEADPILKDRINISVTLFMPLPLNNIAVTLQGSVDLTL